MPDIQTNEPIKKVLPLIPLRNLVLFPTVQTSVYVGRKESVNAIMHAYNNTNRLIVVTAQRKFQADKPTIKDLYSVGVLARIDNIVETEGHINAVITALSRINITSLVQSVPFHSVEFIDLPVISESVDEIQSSADALINQIKKSISKGRHFDLPVLIQLPAGVNSSDLADQVCFAVDANLPERQQMLETLMVGARLRQATEYLVRELKVAEVEMDIEKKTQEKFTSSMKRNVLEERKHQIEKELKKLGKKSEHEYSELETKIKKAKMPEPIKKKCTKELKRLTDMGPYAPESSYLRSYLESVCELPWGSFATSDIAINKAEKILNVDHFGLKDIKERILEYLAVIQLKNKKKNDSQTTNILCFIGPPGVGKTSLGKSIARALGRSFVRASLGGIRDEAEIRGHRRTYVGAMPGRIVDCIKNAKSMNPVFMLDEVDKLGADYRGDPSSALLEVLDPEQNREYVDHYLDFPLDLSKVFFILTGNDLSTIPHALRDRLEIINFSSYTQAEKFNIAKKYLVEKQLKANGLSSKNIKSLKDATTKLLIEKYTREAGVRELERVFAKLFRKVAKTVVGSKIKTVDLNTPETLEKYLGPNKYSSSLKGKKDQIGVSTGLAWTSVGGDILFIEVNIMPGKGQLILTGKLGSVMKESCQAALSFVRSQSEKFGIKQNFHKIDIHIHVPEGATPKDGPSAGCAITTALISALTGKPIPRDLAMTGEITLRGNVLEIGGLKEKSIAAYTAGIKTIFIPKDNTKSLIEIPKEVKDAIKFLPVENYLEIYKKLF